MDFEYSASLSELRAEIDSADREMLRQLGRRLSLVRRVAELKRAAEAPDRDFARESEILSGASVLGKDEKYGRLLLESVLGICRLYREDNLK